MKKIVLICLLLGLFSAVPVFGRTPATAKARLDEVNRKMTEAFRQRDVRALLGFYEADAVLMPEYQETIVGIGQIGEYYRKFLPPREIRVYAKKIRETIEFEKRIAEIGTFKLEFVNGADKKLTSLNGKYMNIWSVGNNGSLKLRAETYGYLHGVDDPATLLVELSKSDMKPNPPGEKEKAMAFRLNALNTLMEDAVRRRDGNLRADFFTDDAIFMPFADTPKAGMKEIRQHLIEYNSYPVTIDSIGIYNIYFEDHKGYVIEYPRFKVEWHTTDQQGTGTGKGLRLWKKGADCSLKIYREIGIHDHAE